MIQYKTFPYKPSDNEKEKAATSYLMSLVAIVIGLPLPIVNFLTTWFFYLGNRKSTPFVKWHCTQALIAQLFLFIINATAVSWTLAIFFGGASLTNGYLAYLFTVLLFNFIEFVLTILSAVQVRKGVHTEWWLFGTWTSLMVSPALNKNSSI